MSIKLEIHLCAERRSIFVTFASDEIAAAYVKKNGHRFACSPLNEEDTDEYLAFPLTYDALYPTCEHGLSLSLCSGPNHYETHEQERARAGF